MMTRKPLLTLLLLLTALSLYGQAHKVGLNFQAFYPQDVFASNGAEKASGIQLHYAYRPRESRLYYGAELSYASSAPSEYDVTFEGRPLLIKDINNQLAIYSSIQYHILRSKLFILYTEAKLGITGFMTYRRAQRESSDWEGDGKLHGVALNKALAVGLMFNIAPLFKPEKQPQGFWLDFALGLNTGTKATYRTAPVGTGPFTLNSNLFKSSTTSVMYEIGLTAILDFDF